MFWLLFLHILFFYYRVYPHWHNTVHLNFHLHGNHWLPINITLDIRAQPKSVLYSFASLILFAVQYTIAFHSFFLFIWNNRFDLDWFGLVLMPNLTQSFFLHHKRLKPEFIRIYIVFVIDWMNQANEHLLLYPFYFHALRGPTIFLLFCLLNLLRKQKSLIAFRFAIENSSMQFHIFMRSAMIYRACGLWLFQIRFIIYCIFPRDYIISSLLFLIQLKLHQI